MRGLFVSDFFLRFAGGFALGAAAIGGVQLLGWLSGFAHAV